MQLVLCPCCGKPVRPRTVTPFSAGPLAWAHGQGFPKSHDISKAIDKAAGAEREVVGTIRKTPSAASENMHDGWRRPWAEGKDKTMDLTAPATPLAATWDGYGTALKPAWEPIILAMKPLDGTFAQNALRHGVAGLNVDGARIEANLNPNDYDDTRRTAPKFSGKYNNGKQGQYRASSGEVPSGRWPANLLLDEVAAAALDAQSGERPSATNTRATNGHHFTAGNAGEPNRSVYLNGAPYAGDTGGASRFFYVAKASRAERERGLEDGNNHHPTVKPLKLMEYLCTLTATPTGGVVLDPFMGSGTTGVACMQTGRGFIGCEIDAGYFEIARRRIEDAAAQLHLPLEMEQ